MKIKKELSFMELMEYIKNNDVLEDNEESKVFYKVNSNNSIKRAVIVDRNKSISFPEYSTLEDKFIVYQEIDNDMVFDEVVVTRYNLNNNSMDNDLYANNSINDVLDIYKYTSSIVKEIHTIIDGKLTLIYEADNTEEV